MECCICIELSEGVEDGVILLFLENFCNLLLVLLFKGKMVLGFDFVFCIGVKLVVVD